MFTLTEVVYILQNQFGYLIVRPQRRTKSCHCNCSILYWGNAVPATSWKDKFYAFSCNKPP